MSLPGRGLIERPRGIGPSLAELDIERLEATLERETKAQILVNGVTFALIGVAEPFTKEVVEVAIDLDQQARRAREVGLSIDFSFNSTSVKERRPKNISRPNLLQKVGVGTTEVVEIEHCVARWSAADEDLKKWGGYELRWKRNMATGLIVVKNFEARTSFGDINPNYIFEGESLPSTFLKARFHHEPEQVDDWQYGHRLWELGLHISPAVAWNEEAEQEPPYEMTSSQFRPDLMALLAANSKTPSAYGGGNGLENISFNLDLYGGSFSSTSRFFNATPLADPWMRNHDYASRYVLNPDAGELFERGNPGELKQVISKPGIEYILQTMISSAKF